MRIGHSKDIHRLVAGRKLILGGVEIKHYLGLEGHSDADVVYHSVAEAIIGALGLGDLGTLFPDNDPQYLNIDSSYFMNEARLLLAQAQYKINNIDLTIYLEKPLLVNYKESIKSNIAKILDIDKTVVNVKATRGEGLGPIGLEEGISCETVILISKQ